MIGGGPCGPGPLARLFGACLTRPGLCLGVLFAVLVASAYLASRLELRSDFSELLPTSDPAVRALERTRGRVGDMNLLLLGIRSPSRDANLRYAADLTQALRQLSPGLCELAAYDLRDIMDFFRANRWLYADETDLLAARDRLSAEILQRKNPFAVSLDDDEETDADWKPRTPGRLADLAKRFPDGYFVRGDYAWVATLPPGGVFGSGERLLAEIQRFIREHPPATYHPAMTVMPTGPVMSGIQNRQAIENDILAVTILCTLVIAASILIFFRSKFGALVVALPAVVGTVFTFGITRVAIGYLNSSTAFLGTIILGNGINPAIMLMARFRELRAHDPVAPSPSLWRTAAGELWRPTLGAACAASLAYASLMLTRFRGFSQFGFMGAVGALSCWAATFLGLPALLLMMERFIPVPRALAREPRELGFLGAFVTRHSKPIVFASIGLTLLAIAGSRHFLDQPFEYDFRKLSTDLDHEPNYVEFDRNLDDLFGRWHSPHVLLADRLDQVEPMKDAIRRKDRVEKPFVGQVVTVFDILPGNPVVQGRKLAVLAEIRRLLDDQAINALDGPRRARLLAERPPERLRVLGPGDLPPLARRPFTEADGTVGRVLLAYHSQVVSMWNGRDLLGLATVLQSLSLPDGTVLENAGVPMVFGAMLRAILHDGPLATALAFLSVLIVVPLVMRPFRAGIVAVVTLIIGIVWMLGAAGWLGVKITFLNFVALPITFGIGVEYAVNVMNRARASGDVATAVAATGGAVALCSWTTIVGYGSLLAAHSHALRGFGGMAILGEIACLLAATVALPATLSWRRGHK